MSDIVSWLLAIGSIIAAIGAVIVAIGTYLVWRQQRYFKSVDFFRGIINPFFIPILLGMKEVKQLLSSEKVDTKRIKNAIESLKDPPSWKGVHYVQEYMLFIPALENFREKLIEELNKWKQVMGVEQKNRVQKAYDKMDKCIKHALGLET